MVNRHKLGKSAKTRGNGYENEVAKQLSNWYGREQPAFYRVPGSGSHHWSTSMNVDADVTADPDLKFNYIIECKRYAGWTIENLIMNNSYFPSWVAQAIREGMAVGHVPLLIYRRNLIKSYVTAPYNRKLTKLDTYLVTHTKYTSEVDGNEKEIKTVTFMLADVLAKYDYDQFNKLYDDTDWTKQVTMIKAKPKSKAKPVDAVAKAMKELSKL